MKGRPERKFNTLQWETRESRVGRNAEVQSGQGPEAAKDADCS
jgi:hypothetical protein